MNVNRKLLEKKSNEELENYLSKDNHYVAQAVRYAFEILKNRGKNFTEEDQLSIDKIIASKEKEEEIYIHPNHCEASKLLYFTAILSVLNLFLIDYQNTNLVAITVMILLLIMNFLIGLLTSRGTDWTKYLLIIVVIIGIAGFPLLIKNIQEDLLLGTVNIIQAAIQLWCLTLLFKIPRISINRK